MVSTPLRVPVISGRGCAPTQANGPPAKNPLRLPADASGFARRAISASASEGRSRWRWGRSWAGLSVYVLVMILPNQRAGFGVMGKQVALCEGRDPVSLFRQDTDDTAGNEHPGNRQTPMPPDGV